MSTEGLISAALLGRARSIAAEHSKLSELLVQDFDPKVAKKAGELSAVAAILKDWEHASEVVLQQHIEVTCRLLTKSGSQSKSCNNSFKIGQQTLSYALLPLKIYPRPLNNSLASPTTSKRVSSLSTLLPTFLVSLKFDLA